MAVVECRPLVDVCSTPGVGGGHCNDSTEVGVSDSSPTDRARVRPIKVRQQSDSRSDSEQWCPTVLRHDSAQWSDTLVRHRDSEDTQVRSRSPVRYSQGALRSGAGLRYNML